MFRYGVGADYFAYNYLYDQAKNSVSEQLIAGSDRDIAYVLISSVFKSFGLSYQVFVASVAAVTLFFIYRLCRDYSRRPTLSMFVYYCFFYLTWSFSGYRQALVMTVGMYFFIRWKNKAQKYIPLAVVLSFIHLSAVILLIMYMFSRINISFQKLVLFSLIAALLSMLPLQNLLGYISPTFIDRLNPYVADGSSGIAYIIKILPRIIFLFLGLAVYNSRKTSEKERYYIRAFILGMIFFIALSSSDLIASRISLYGYYYIILVLPLFMSLYVNVTRIKIRAALYIMFIIITGLYLIKNGQDLISQSGIQCTNSCGILPPYTNIFNTDIYTFKKI
ncbi:EpsG family protein [Candidatus Saccharibacteria bacterium]|nr:MAG: EpsG family protein [Candidatus Saccharibacteria bacterium]